MVARQVNDFIDELGIRATQFSSPGLCRLETASTVGAIRNQSKNRHELQRSINPVNLVNPVNFVNPVVIRQPAPVWSRSPASPPLQAGELERTVQCLARFQMPGGSPDKSGLA